MSSLAPTCSVCIANYNGIGVLDACIRSVIAQDCDFEVEIIVHDDASTDDSVALITKHYPEVRLIQSQNNVGFCTANNRMVGLARGKYVLLLNNDAELFPDALGSLNRAASEADSACILGLPQYDAATGELIDIGSLFDPFLNPLPNLCARGEDVGMIIGACLWIPRSVWMRLGGFPEWFHTLAEDMYLCCVARINGIPVRALGTSGFRHRVGNSLGGGKVQEGGLITTLRRRRLSERNKTFVMVITYPSPILELLLPLHMVLLLIEGVALAMLKRNARLLREIYLPCFRALWLERTRLLNRRRQVQRERRVNARGFFAPFVCMPHKLRMLWRYGIPDIRQGPG